MTPPLLKCYSTRFTQKASWLWKELSNSSCFLLNSQANIFHKQKYPNVAILIYGMTTLPPSFISIFASCLTNAIFSLSFLHRNYLCTTMCNHYYLTTSQSNKIVSLVIRFQPFEISRGLI